MADKIAAAVRASPAGAMTGHDLEDLPRHRTADARQLSRLHIVSMPPPSSGGALLIEMLNVLTVLRCAPTTRPRSHLLVETIAVRLCRPGAVLGDPIVGQGADRGPALEDATPRCAPSIRARAAPSDEDPRRRAGGVRGPEHHALFSIVDRFGNAVANTYTLNLSYGVGLIAEGTGVLLNNELDDFAAAPGAPNAFGLVGFEANEPGPNKRPLSSMTPTIVLKDGKPVLVTGSPGGSRIITAVLQVILM